MKLSEDMFKLQQQERDNRIVNMDLDKVALYAKGYYVYMMRDIMTRLPPPLDKWTIISYASGACLLLSCLFNSTTS